MTRPSVNSSVCIAHCSHPTTSKPVKPSFLLGAIAPQSSSSVYHRGSQLQ
ncbi:MAG: hypothetical protein KME27_00540 [Lyngbya sp. HA4199-MV5]|nr:hypothetical protein [Lyngbya sp. HA4199-MV5]